MGSNILLRFHLHDAFEQEAAKRIYESAVRDPLTQSYNRRYLDERLASEYAFAARHGSPLSVILVAVLRIVAGTMQRILRTEDLVARYGGEEFCVVARGIDARNAMIVAERIRKTVSSLNIPWEGRTLSVTLSAGVATLRKERPYPDVDAILAAADTALYRAKESGRNRCYEA